MNTYDFRELFDALSTARIYAGAELERSCNNNEYIDACVFQAIRDSIAQNIQLLQSYVTVRQKVKIRDESRRNVLQGHTRISAFQCTKKTVDAGAR